MSLLSVGLLSWFSRMLHRHMIIMLGLIFALMSATAFAAPANDNFANAINLSNSLSGSVTGTNIEATTEVNEPILGSTGSTVWWRWTAPATGSLVVNTLSSNFDTTLTLLSGSSLASLSSLAFNDDTTGLLSSVTFNVTQGSTYYFRVGGYNTGTNNGYQGNITLNWLLTQPQTISFPTISNRLLGAAPFTITANASSGLAVSFTSATPAVCAVSGNTVTLLVASTCTITANQVGDANYAPAPQVTQSFSINNPIAAGVDHSLRIGTDGKLYAWGINGEGQLGDGTTTTRTTSVQVNLPSGVSPVAVTAGAYHSLAIGNDGKLYAWGLNNFGQLGDGTTTQRNTPVQVNLPSGVSPVAVAAGGSHSLAMGSDGKLYAWGYNLFGALGDGTTTDRTTPVQVNLPSGVSAVSVTAGAGHSLAIGSDGKLYAWGYNLFGALGDGTTTDRTTPVQVNLPSGVSAVSVSAGGLHSLAIGSDGKLYAWGYNLFGALGDGTTTSRTTPVQVNLPSGVSAVSVSARGSNSLAMGSDGKLYAWGDNFYGQLGDGTTTQRTSPVQVNLPSGVSPVAVTAGGLHSLAIGSDGKLYAWGRNSSGQLGDGTTADRNTPVQGGLKQAQTITFASIASRALGAAPFTITANASSGLAVSFTSATPAVCAVSGNTVTVLVASTCTIRANQVGDANYDPAPQVTQSFSINNPIDGGFLHSLRMGSDGKLYAWGRNDYGELGDGTTATRTTSVQVNLPSGVSPVAVTAGGGDSIDIGSDSLAIGSDGKLYAWGANFYGQLGDGTTTNRTTPVQVNLPTGVSPVAVAAGNAHSLAIGSDGKLYAWGANLNAQLGDGTTTQRTSPVQVNLATGVSPVAVAAGYLHSLAIGSDGKLYVWGWNFFGNLGDGTTTNRTTPVQVNLATGVSPVAVTAGQYHSLAIGSDGKLYAWGSNANGELGDGTTTNRTTPVQVNLPTGVSPVAVTAGRFHSLAIGSDGKLYAWGRNANGELGDGTTTNRTTPVQVNLPTGVSPVAVTAGGLHSLAIGSDGKLYAWGRNSSGQLGDGTTTDRNTPVQGGLKQAQTITFASIASRALGAAPFTITANASSGLAVSFTSATPAVCAVSGNTVTLLVASTCTITANQVGDANYAPAPQVTQSFSINNPIDGGGLHSLRMGTDAKLYAWGWNGYGQLGDGTTTQSNTPVQVTLPSGVSSVAVTAGLYHSMAIGSDGKLYAWGDSSYGQLGDGTSTTRTTPVQVNLPSGVSPVALTAGQFHSLAIGSDGKLYAWGVNGDGQLGDGTTTQRTSPVQVNLPSGVSPVAVTAGQYHSMAIGSDGKLYAWGWNGYGQLGDGTTTQSSTPVQVNLPSGVSPVAVVAGDFHSLAIGSDGKLYAWGYNFYGQLGDGTTTNRTTPVQVNLPSGVSSVAVTAGIYHSMAIGSDGKLYAWGDSSYGQLGDGTTTTRTTPVQVNLPSGVSPAAVTAGQLHSLAIGSDGNLYAWGRNTNGELGDGTITNKNTPVIVVRLGQTISFASIASRALGDAPFTITAAASSGLAVSFTSATLATCQVSGNTVTLLATGTCTITANQAGNATYAPALQVSQSFTVSLASQSINFAALSNQTLGASPFTLSATASSGLTVTFSSISPSVCSVTGNTVTLLAAGTCTIEANQSGNANYSSASPVQQSFTVSMQNGGGGADSDGDVPLPEWLLVLMSASLLGTALRKRL